MGSSWPLVLASAIAVPEAISLVSALLQRSRIGSPLPADLAGIYEQDEYDRANKYAKAKSDFGLVRGTFDIVVFYAFWFLGGFPWLDDVCVGLGLPNDMFTGLVFIAILCLGHMLLGIPWSILGTFVLETRFGFNRTTPLTFCKDIFKSLVLGIVLGGPLVYLVLWFFTATGSNGWIYVFAITVAVQMIAAYAAPAVILPLFLEMLPLPPGSALLTSEEGGGSAHEFLRGRTLYECAGGCNGKRCWQTRDRRFAGAKAGSSLSVWWSHGDGTPGCGDGPVYAVSTTSTLESYQGGKACSLEWALTAEALGAAEHNGAIGAGRNGCLRGPLVQESAPCPSTLETLCIDLGSLHSKILALAERVGYRGANIFVIDGSSRSGHSNAFCTGFGRFRRICLSDTLFPLMDEGEILAVMGHEIGHDRLHHVHIRLLFGLLEYFVMLFALGGFLTSPAISSAFFVPQPKIYLGIVLFSVVWSVVEFAISVPFTVQARMHEFSADRFSVEADKSYGPLLCSALKKLVRKSKINLTPHPFTAFLTYSHPPLDARLKAIREHHMLRHGGDRNARELNLWSLPEQ